MNAQPEHYLESMLLTLVRISLPDIFIMDGGALFLLISIEIS
jgi:hypothetical protein